MSPQLPSKLGRYDVLDEIGRGSMGLVYLAKDPLIGRLVALKTLRIDPALEEADGQQFRARFIREAQSAGILSHRNIVTVHDVVEESDEGVTFIAMEYMRGTNLKQMLRRDKPLSLNEIADIVAQVADGLDYAHSRGVVHRDIKPANILIDSDGVVKITDFGIARLNTSNLTHDGQLLGTPNYMAPEQVRGEATDHRADIFSLGVMLYEMFTRQKPFQGENLTVVTHRIVYEAHTPLENHISGMPEGVANILDTALAKDPDDRYASVLELSDDLQRVAVQVEAEEALNETQEIPPLVDTPGSDRATGGSGQAKGSTGAGLGVGKIFSGIKTWLSQPASVKERAKGPKTSGAKATSTSQTAERPKRASTPQGSKPTAAGDATAATAASETLSAGAKTSKKDEPAESKSKRPEPQRAAPKPSESAGPVIATPPPPSKPPPPSVLASAEPPQSSSAPKKAGKSNDLRAKPAPAKAPKAKPQATSKRSFQLKWVAMITIPVLLGGLLWAVLSMAAARPKESVEPTAEQLAEQRMVELVKTATERLELEDYRGALRSLLEAESIDPENQALITKRREVEARVGDLDRLAMLAVELDSAREDMRLADEERRWQDAIDHALAVSAMAPGDEEADRISQQAEEMLRREERRRTARLQRPTEVAEAAPEPVEVPTEEPVMIPVEPEPPAVPPSGRATLDLYFYTEMPEGVLTIYVDDQQLLLEKFSFFKGRFRPKPRPGTIEGQYEIAAGAKTIRVYVSLPDRAPLIRTLEGNIASDTVRRLDVRVASESDVAARLE